MSRRVFAKPGEPQHVGKHLPTLQPARLPARGPMLLCGGGKSEETVLEVGPCLAADSAPCPATSPGDGN